MGAQPSICQTNQLQMTKQVAVQGPGMFIEEPSLTRYGQRRLNTTSYSPPVSRIMSGGASRYWEVAANQGISRLRKATHYLLLRPTDQCCKRESLLALRCRERTSLQLALPANKAHQICVSSPIDVACSQHTRSQPWPDPAHANFLYQKTPDARLQTSQSIVGPTCPLRKAPSLMASYATCLFSVTCIHGITYCTSSCILYF
ncbi:hypothetical protein BDP81DRAFT_59405 [Colletotrichum phormii]|uniref:Uncharacterized protein n=1 Tax=Colletotrichum phormii TaxID=359342 RepID=A0AAI9ZP27_9PEZI|nr:uncharacterized protein BDP81DRAFT_59405 [Colletotrichum phormii]KAK1634458.1 hypothetical protein BDP81DRAFT_59405 [Colletotrichum phormii]